MSLRERWTDIWQRTSARERMLVALGALVVFFGAGWPLLWQPVTQDLARSDVWVAEARAARERARAAADEIAGLERETRSPRTADARAAVERVVAARGLGGSLTSLDAQTMQLRITFAAVDFQALAQFLDMLGREEHLFVVEALIATRVESGQVRAELTLARPTSR